MQKWEYMSVWVDEEWKVQTIVGHDDKKLQELPHFVEFLNLVGMVGWEMVAPVKVERGHRFFFKRPKKSNPEQPKGE